MFNNQWYWLLYWGFFVVALVIDIIQAFRVYKRKWIPVLGAVVTVVAPVCLFFFAIGRGPMGPNEFVYLFEQMFAGNLFAWTCCVLFILTVVLLIYSLVLPVKSKKV